MIFTRGLIFFSFILISFSGFSQIEIDRNDLYLIDQKNPTYEKNDSLKSLLSFGLRFDLNSDAVTNDFIKGMLYQGFIDDDRKDLVTNRLKEVNRFGYEFTGGFTYKYRLKKDITLIAGLNQRQQFNAKFTKDIFELIFRGNKQYVGEHAQLSPFDLTYFDYQGLFLGVQKNINSKLILGAGISFLRGGRYQALKIERGTLYTDTAGAYLDFDMKFNLAFSESKNFFTSNGKGVALNFNGSYLLGSGQLNFEIRELGFIRWKDLNFYEGDSTYRYDGANVNDILDFSDSTFTQIKADKIAGDLNISKQKKNITYFVPATIHLNYLHHLSDKLSMVAGVKYMLNANYIPRVYFKSIYYLKKNFIIAPSLAYGGFGRMDFEIGAAKSFRDTFIVSVNVFYLEYLLLPKKSSGHGFNFSLTKLF
jgi:hypothetical protein